MKKIINFISKTKIIIFILYLIFIAAKYFSLTCLEFSHGRGFWLDGIFALLLALILLAPDAAAVVHIITAFLVVTDLFLSNSLVLLPVFAAEVFYVFFTEKKKRNQATDRLINTLLAAAFYAEILTLILLVFQVPYLAAGHAAAKLGTDIFLLVMLLIKWAKKKNKIIRPCFQILSLICLIAMLLTSFAGVFVRRSSENATLIDIQDGQEFYLMSSNRYAETLSAVNSKILMQRMKYGRGQKFHLEMTEDGYYHVISGNGGYLLTKSDMNDAGSIPVYLREDKDSERQNWILRENNGFLELVYFDESLSLGLDDEGAAELSLQAEDFTIVLASEEEKPLWCLSRWNRVVTVLMMILLTEFVLLFEAFGARKRPALAENMMEDPSV